jgi:hypothetical protein
MVNTGSKESIMVRTKIYLAGFLFVAMLVSTKSYAFDVTGNVHLDLLTLTVKSRTFAIETAAAPNSLIVVEAELSATGLLDIELRNKKETNSCQPRSIQYEPMDLVTCEVTAKMFPVIPDVTYCGKGGGVNGFLNGIIPIDGTLVAWKYWSEKCETYIPTNLGIEDVNDEEEDEECEDCEENADYDSWGSGWSIEIEWEWENEWEEEL